MPFIYATIILIGGTMKFSLFFLISFTLIGIAEAATCKQYSSCEQAVRNWCAGNHPRADGDNDGIPCENVCPSK
ncbi:MAG: excalibur calcium-binding domain-containing protein, partial [Pseudomonadota bacterium]